MIVTKQHEYFCHIFVDYSLILNLIVIILLTSESFYDQC